MRVQWVAVLIQESGRVAMRLPFWHARPAVAVLRNRRPGENRLGPGELSVHATAQGVYTQRLGYIWFHTHAFDLTMLPREVRDESD